MVLHRGGAENPVVFAMSTSYMLLVLVGLLLLTYVVIRLWLTRAPAMARRERWDGGVRRLLPEMTYTATGFSNPVRVIFDAIFRPTTVEDTRETVAEHFRMAIRREKERVHMRGPTGVPADEVGDAVVRARSGGDAPRTHQRLRDLCLCGFADRRLPCCRCLDWSHAFGVARAPMNRCQNRLYAQRACDRRRKALPHETDAGRNRRPA